MVLKLASIAVAVGLTVGCVPEVDNLEGQVYEICYRGLPARIERVSSATAEGVLRIDEVDFGDATLDDPRVGLRALGVTPASGIVDFEFVDAAHVQVVDERILDLPAAPAELYGESAEPPNLMPHALDGDLALTLVFEGAVPQSSWRVDIDACFNVDGISVQL